MSDVAQVFDHLTASDDDDEVWVSLCGLSEDDLPKAPTCPRCERLRRRERQPVRRILGAVFLPHGEATARR